MSGPNACYPIPPPPPGDPAAIRRAAGAWASAGTEFSNQGTSIGDVSAATASVWSGTGGDTFRRAGQIQSQRLHDMASLATTIGGELNHMAQQIENAQADYKARLDRLLHPPSSGMPWGAILGGIGLVAVQFIPGVDVAVDTAAVTDAAVTAADVATTATAAAATTEVVAAAADLETITTGLQGALRAAASSITSNTQSFTALAKSMAIWGASGGAFTAATEIPSGHFSLTDIGISALTSSLGPLVPGGEAWKIGVTNVLGTGTQELVHTGTIDPGALTLQAELGGIGGIAEERLLPLIGPKVPIINRFIK